MIRSRVLKLFVRLVFSFGLWPFNKGPLRLPDEEDDLAVHIELMQNSFVGHLGTELKFRLTKIRGQRVAGASKRWNFSARHSYQNGHRG